MGWSYRTNQSDRVEVASGADGPGYVIGKPVVYSADGAISPNAGFAVLTKGSAGAYTLAAPTVDGIALEITAGSAFAHVVTATSLIQDGVTGGAKSSWTSAAFVGSSLKLRSYNGTWYVIGKNLGTIA